MPKSLLAKYWCIKTVRTVLLWFFLSWRYFLRFFFISSSRAALSTNQSATYKRGWFKLHLLTLAALNVSDVNCFLNSKSRTWPPSEKVFRRFVSVRVTKYLHLLCVIFNNKRNLHCFLKPYCPLKSLYCKKSKVFYSFLCVFCTFMSHINQNVQVSLSYT